MDVHLQELGDVFGEEHVSPESQNTAIPNAFSDRMVEPPGLTFPEKSAALYTYEPNAENCSEVSGILPDSASRGPSMSHVDKQGRANMVDTSDVRLHW